MLEGRNHTHEPDPTVVNDQLLHCFVALQIHFHYTEKMPDFPIYPVYLAFHW